MSSGYFPLSIRILKSEKDFFLANKKVWVEEQQKAEL